MRTLSRLTNGGEIMGHINLARSDGEMGQRNCSDKIDYSSNSEIHRDGKTSRDIALA
jgi:hypothetical protein